MPTITTNSIGSAGGRAYSTPQAWEDAAPANLVTSDVVWRGECYNDSIFTGSTNRLTIAGSTSDATRYKEITAAAGQSFADTPSNPLMFSASNGATLRTSGAYTRTLIVSEDNARISRLQFDLTVGGSWVFEVSAAIAVDGCIFHSDTSNSRTGTLTGGSWTNNLFLSKRSSVGTPAISIGGAASFSNNLIVNMPGGAASDGVAFGYASAVVRNSASVGWTKGFDRPANSASTTFSNCFQSGTGTTYTGLTNSLAFTTATFANVTSGTLDFKLVSGSALIDSGTSSGAPTADIFGTSRPSGASYDVGPHEYASAPSPITGTLTATLGAATLSATGALAIKGTTSVTLGAATLVSTGASALRGTLTATLGAATLSATSVATLRAVLSQTLGAATLAATGALALKGTSSVTLGAATLTSSAVAALRAQLSTTLGAATLSASAAAALKAELTATLGDATLVAAGVSTEANTGSLTATLGDATLVSTATLALRAESTIALGDATLVATAALQIGATANILLAEATMVSEGIVTLRAQSTILLDDATLVATATLLNNGVLDAVLGAATLIATAEVYTPGSGGASAGQIWAYLLPNGISAGQSVAEIHAALTGSIDGVQGVANALSVLLAVAAGTTHITKHGDGTALVEFDAVDGSGVRVAADMDGSERTNVEITP